MIPHYSDPLVTLYLGDCLDVMRELPDASVDSVVTDPPYGLEFMGKDWDSLGTVGKQPKMGKPTGDPHRRNTGTPSWGANGNPNCRNCGGDKYRNGERKCSCEAPDFGNHAGSQSRAMQTWHEQWATEAFRVLKPGGYLLAFGGTRTYHRLASAIEDAGFEIRDTLMWIYASGFPKSLDVSKALDKVAGDLARKWEGWGTALKPAHEPIVMARKPLVGTVATNVTRYGTGALNIDGSRIGTNGRLTRHTSSNGEHRDRWEGNTATGEVTEHGGRWPSNVLLSDPELFDEPNPGVVGSGATSVSGWRNEDRPEGAGGVVDSFGAGSVTGQHFGDSGGYSRFFKVPEGECHCDHERPDGEHRPGPGCRMCSDCRAYPTAYIIPKASRAERERGLVGGRPVDAMGLTHGGPGEPGKGSKEGYQYKPAVRANHHPTVKPINLMRHLVRLVTPPGGIVLDPFLGSGTTAIAASEEGFQCIGIEREAEYVEIAKGRITATNPGLGLR